MARRQGTDVYRHLQLCALCVLCALCGNYRAPAHRRRCRRLVLRPGREAGPLFQLLSILEEMSTEHGFSEAHSLSTPAEREGVASVMRALEDRIGRQKYISPEYQHVDGTSFASPITASVAAQLLEIDPTLDPGSVREALVATAIQLDDVPKNVQGAGLLRPRAAVDWVRARLATRS